MTELAGFFVMLGLMWLGSDIKQAARILAEQIDPALAKATQP